MSNEKEIPPMLKPITAALGLALMGCNLPDPTAGLSPAQKARCDYEAQLATASIYSGLAAGAQAGILRNQCYDLRRLENQERQAPAASAPTPNQQFSMNNATFLGGLAEGCGGVSSATLQRYRSSVTAVPDDPEWNLGRASATRADAEQCAAARRRVLERARTQ
jgi:hypothetical protein